MISARNGIFAALLVKRTPFTAGRAQPPARWVSSATPAPLGGARRRVLPSVYQAFLDQGDARREADFAAATPSTSIRWRTTGRSSSGARTGGTSGAATPSCSRPSRSWSTAWWCWAGGGPGRAACVFLPLRLVAAEGRRAPGAARYGAFFAAIAIGYMAVEIALLQKFGLFLGHPNYALSVVLAALLLSTGWGRSSRRQSWPRCAISASSPTCWPGSSSWNTCCVSRPPALIGLPFAARVALVFALVTPVGVCLGVFMPRAWTGSRPPPPPSPPGRGASTGSSPS